MKRILIFVLILVALAACSTQPKTAVPESPASSQNNTGQDVQSTPMKDSILADYLNTDFEDAASLRNQLALGILTLEGTTFAVTAEQARTLLPLYQVLVTLTGDNTAASEEVNAVQTQIMECLTPEQLQTIVEMQITTTDLNAFYMENGLAIQNPDAESTRVPGTGMGKNLDQADREATRTAMGETETGVGSGGGQGSEGQGRTLLFDQVIQLLSERAGN